MSHPLDKHKPLKHLLSKQTFHPPICTECTLNHSHLAATPLHHPSQLPLSSLSTSTPTPGRHLHTQTDCTLSGPGPAWQLAPPVRLCAHPLSQRIRIAFSMGGEGAVVLALPQYHRSSIVPPLAGRLMGPQPLAPANWCAPLQQ